MGTDYWLEQLAFLQKMARLGMISPSDLNLVYATDSVDDAIEHIRCRAIEPFGLKPVTRRSRIWLGEHGLFQRKSRPRQRSD